MNWKSLVVAALMAFFLGSTMAQQPSPPPSSPSPGKDANPADVSGMFTFLRDGEFVQLTVEDGNLSGLISRYGDTDSDKGQFIDQFFQKATLEGGHLTWATKMVHGVWYEFKGSVDVAPNKQPGQEGYRVMKGTLTVHALDAHDKDKTTQRQVEFKSFPGAMGS